MKTTSKRIITALLALLMVMSLSTGIFAASAANVKQYDSYFSIGDSVAVCWGYEPDDYFPKLIGKAVGYEVESDRDCFDHCGLRTTDVLVALGEMYQGMTEDEMNETDPFYEAANFDSGMLLRDSEYLINGIKNAELITIEVGLNDVFYGPLAVSGLAEAFGSGDVGTMLEALKTNTELMNKGFLTFCRNFPKIIEKIYELKAGQDFDIVIIGAYNSLNCMRINDSIDFPLGDIEDSYVSAMNAKYKSIARKYDLTYVDISNVETGSMECGMSMLGGVFTSDVVTSSLMTHPSYPDGYEYIARQVIAALPTEEAKPDTNIRIDIGRVEKITNVAVGSLGIKTDDYTYENYVLTVDYPLPTASKLAITYEKNGKIGYTVYDLKYKLGTGYVASLDYTTTDLAKSKSNIKNNIKTVVTLPSTLIKSAFGK